jgi:hypothetical protein
MDTDSAEYSGERHLLEHYGERLLRLAVRDQAHVSRHVDTRGTRIAAGDEGGLPLGTFDVDIQQRAGGADLDTGTAELAPGLFKGGRDWPYVDFAVSGCETQGSHSAYIPADSHAARAAYAQVVVLSEQGFVFLDGQVTVYVPWNIRRKPDVESHRLQFAVAQLGAAAFQHRQAVRA